MSISSTNILFNIKANVIEFAVKNLYNCFALVEFDTLLKYFIFHQLLHNLRLVFNGKNKPD
jgi:hypothetical protein